MRLEKNPVYRRVIIPWYDSNILCIALSVFLVFVIAFGIIGIFTALDEPELAKVIWIPIVLIAISTGCLISTGLRLGRRYIDSLSK